MGQLAPVGAYHAPDTLRECLDVLSAGDGVLVLAGGQSMMPLLRSRQLRAETLLDLGRVGELRQREVAADGSGPLVLGAMVRYRDLLDDPVITQSWPALSDAAWCIGDRQVQNRGTIGGNLVFGGFATDMKQVVICLGGELVISGPHGERIVSASALYSPSDAPSKVLKPGELLRAVRFPIQPVGSGSAYAKYGITANGRPVIGVAARVTLGESGECASARIVVGGLVPGPVDARRAAELIAGRVIDGDLITAAANACADEVKTQSDLRALSDYRTQLIRAYTRRVLVRAHARAQEAHT